MRDLRTHSLLRSVSASCRDSEKGLLCSVEDRQAFEFPALPQTVGACTIGSIAQLIEIRALQDMSETTDSLSYKRDDWMSLCQVRPILSFTALSQDLPVVIDMFSSWMSLLSLICAVDECGFELESRYCASISQVCGRAGICTGHFTNTTMAVTPHQGRRPQQGEESSSSKSPKMQLCVQQRKGTCC